MSGSQIATALIVLLTPVATQAQITLSSVAPGCYQVNMGAWSGSFPSGMPEGHQPPPLIQLDTTRMPGIRAPLELFRVTPNIPSLERYRIVPPYWTTTQVGDTIMISWSSGFMGTTLVLTRNAEGFAGQARAFYDVIGPVQPRAEVTLVRRSCGGVTFGTANY